MLESRLHQGIVFASDLAFSREGLNNYENAYFFNPFDAKQLAKLMEDIVIGKIKYKEIKEDKTIQRNQEWQELINELIREPYIRVLK